LAQEGLAFIRNMGGNAGDNLQIIHAPYLFSPFPVSVADLPLPFIKGKAFEGKERAEQAWLFL